MEWAMRRSCYLTFPPGGQCCHSRAGGKGGKGGSAAGAPQARVRWGRTGVQGVGRGRGGGGLER